METLTTNTNSTKVWNKDLYWALDELGLSIQRLTDEEECYTSEFCERIINKVHKLLNEGYNTNFIAIDIIYNDLKKEDSQIIFQGININ